MAKIQHKRKKIPQTSRVSAIIYAFFLSLAVKCLQIQLLLAPLKFNQHILFVSEILKLYIHKAHVCYFLMVKISIETTSSVYLKISENR